MKRKNTLLGRPPAFTYHRAEKSQKAVSKLHCDALALSALAGRFGTPLYVYSASTIRERAQAFAHAFRKSPHTICYAVKANSNLTVLRLLAKLGCGFDVVSGGELERVLRADPKAAKRTVFSGVGKTREEINSALKAGILLFNVESGPELELLAKCAAALKRIAPVSLRVNPDVPAGTHPYISTGLHEHKFGVPIAQAHGLYAKAAREKWLQVVGVSVHIGSQITDVQPFAATMKRVADLVRQLRAAGHKIHYADAGGGLGISYQEQDKRKFADQVADYANALLAPLHGLDLHLLVEPGRSIVGPAGALLTRVLFKKTNNGKKFLVVDAAMNDLLRPSLYSAYHEIVPAELSPGAPHETVDVVGPVCESGDFFARNRELPVVEEGDLLAILDAGAYGMVLASNYNTRPRAAEIIVDRTRAKVIRKRESVKELLQLEVLARV